MGTSVDALVERADVLNAVHHLLEEVSSGHSGALFIVGEPGLGKTTALAHACEQAEKGGMAIALGRGDAMETSLPFGLLAQAFDLLGGRGVLEEPVAPGPDSRAAQLYAARRWLAGHATRPVLLALDDLHWADADSLALVSFLCRRLASLPVAVVATLRPWPPSAQTVAFGLAQEGYASTERLALLTNKGAAVLLADRAGQALEGAEVARASELCAGNPLLLEQVALAISRGEDVPGPSSGGSQIVSDELLLSRFAGLPAEGLRCAQAGAVLGTRFRPDLAVRVAGVDDGQADGPLEALERTGLLRASPSGGVEFVHPLFRQALYDDLTGSLRSRLHARAFRLLVDGGLEAEAVDHAIKADLVADPAAISVLERVGRRARRAGAVETATTVLESAVGLAGDQATPELLLDLAEAMASGGRPGDAVGVCERLLARGDLATMIRARTLRAQAQAFVNTGAFEAGAKKVEDCVELAKERDPDFATQTLLAYSLVSWISEGPSKCLAVTTRAREIAQACYEAVRRNADAAWAVNALETGDPSGIEICEAAARAIEAEVPSGSGDGSFAGGGALATFATAAKYIERLSDSEHMYRLRLQRAEQLGVVEEEASSLVGCIETLMRRLHLDDALAFSERCAKLSDLVPLAYPFAGVGSANVLLLMGRLDESEEWGERVEPVVTALGAWSASLWLTYARAWRLLTEGHLAEACELYEYMEATTAKVGIGEPCEITWAGHAMAAYLGCGREADASRVLAWLESSAKRLPCRWPRIAAFTGRALLAESAGDQDEADRFFGEALALHDQVDLPLERLQTQLEYGRFLRRWGRLERARRLLAQAVELGETSGAEWLAGQAREELRVAGGRRRRRHEDPHRLTPQEQRVAALAANGATNPEIARQLYLSVSTVETHLERIYTKLGIHSRREIAAAVVLSKTER